MLRTLSAVALILFGWSQAAAEMKPNVILFLVDDMGWMDSSAYGSLYYETPRMEQFARTALRFTDAYATPLCSPTRASILSGQYSARHGVTSASGHQPPQPDDAVLLPETGPANRPVIYPASRNYLRREQVTLAEVVQSAGYRTAHIGKWHLGLTEPYWPEQQGFDVAFHGKPDPGPGSYFSPYSFRQYQSFPDGPPGEYITDRVTDEAVKFLTENRERPFFLNLWQYGVHGPWGHKEAYTSTFAKKDDPSGRQGNPIMASMLKSIDESLGRILDSLQHLQIADRTIVIFYSDNGGNVHSNTPDDRKQANVKPGHPKYAMLEDWRRWAGDRPPTNNAPLRDGKGRIYEGGIRVPLMIRWPGVTKGGETTDAVVGPIDLYPTVLDMLGLACPAGQILDGESLVPVLSGTGTLKRTAYFTWFPHIVPAVAVRAGDWKLIRRFEPQPEYPDGRELFHLGDDLGETRNLAAERPDKVRELDALIDRFIADTGALAPRPNPAYRPNAATPNRPLGGWVARGCQAEERDGRLVVTTQGPRAFLGTAGLKLTGPVTMTLRYRGDGGAVSVQWRTADQEQFPSTGQTAAATLEPGSTWQDARITLPVEGSLLHVRLYVPAPGLEIESIRLQSDRQPAQFRAWDF